jgi:hypothetical protein
MRSNNDMAKVIFEEVGGDQFWVEVDETTGEVAIIFSGVEIRDESRTLACGEDVPALLAFLQKEYENAVRLKYDAAR